MLTPRRFGELRPAVLAFPVSRRSTPNKNRASQVIAKILRYRECVLLSEVKVDCDRGQAFAAFGLSRQFVAVKI